MWYKRIVKSFLGCIMLFGIAVFSTISACADEPVPDVSIQLLKEPHIDDSKIETSVLVEFYDENFYNDEVYLSYHILNASGEVVVNENERIKIDLDNQGSQKLELTINYEGAKIISGDDKLVIAFDIVDEKNAFWFSDWDAINFRSTSIDTHRTIGQKLLAEIEDSKLIFGINIIVFVISVTVAIYIYRKREV